MFIKINQHLSPFSFLFFTQPIKICILGPPAVGKSTVAQKLCNFYKIHHIDVKAIYERMKSLVRQFWECSVNQTILCNLKLLLHYILHHIHSFIYFLFRVLRMNRYLNTKFHLVRLIFVGDSTASVRQVYMQPPSLIFFLLNNC